MNLNSLTANWREKIASQVPDSDSIEKAFCDQASQQVTNKLKPLMKAPYRLGFEIVKQNDSMTHMLGIFAFKISDDLVYAPVFFLSGKIAGTDLLYRCAPKTFVPANEDWANYLIEQDKDNTGRGISKDIRRQSPTNVDLTKINRPPAYLHSVKYASRHESFAPEGGWDALLSEWTKEASLSPLLKEFIVEDGGMDSVEKIASAITNSHSFAEALACNVAEDAYLPPELLAKLTKKAAKREDKLVLFSGDMFKSLLHVPSGDHEKAASAMSEKGYFLMDKRASEDISVITVDGGAHTLTGVSEPGVYKVVTQTDGSVEAFCAPESSDDLGCCGSGDKGHSHLLQSPDAYDEVDGHHSPLIAVVELTGKKATNSGRHVLGEEVTDTEWNAPKADEKLPKNEWEKHMDDTMSVGKSYRIFDSNAGTLSKPLHVVSKEEKNGVTLYEVLPYPSSWVTSIDIRHNPDYSEVRLSEGILGHTAKFIEVGSEAKERAGIENSSKLNPAYDFEVKHLVLGGDGSLHDWIVREGDHVKAATLHNVNETEFYFKAGPRSMSDRMTKLATVLALTSQFHTTEESAEELIKESKARGSVRFYIEAPIEKRAAVTRLTREPNFITNYDHTYNTDLEVPQRFVLPTDTEQFQAPDQRVGDAWDPSMGQGPQKNLKNGGKPDGIPTSILLKLRPDEMSSFAQEHGLPHVFEHGVVGSLLSTYDSSSMIDKYLPKMEDALDAVGRTLFLFYWKPTDFQKLYGTDDMESLENEMLSNFKSWGDMVLNLMKKCQVKNNGSVAFSN